MKRILLFSLMILCIHQTKAQFSGKGSGTVEDPYLITEALNVEEIRNFQNKEGVVFKLENDVNMSELIEDTYGEDGWYPIPDFRGELNGNGFTISGLFINRPKLKSVGFFSNITYAKIHDLLLEYDGDIIGAENVGGICGTCEFVEVCRCGIRGKNIISQGQSYYSDGTSSPVHGNIGGLIGSAKGATIKECIVETTMIFGSHCGGLAGEAVDGIISDNRVNVNDIMGEALVNSMSDYLWVAGIVAYSNRNTINNNLFEGERITNKGRSSYTGGIVGLSNSKGDIYSNVEICDSIIIYNSSVGRIIGDGKEVSITDPKANRAYNKTVLSYGKNVFDVTDNEKNGLSVGSILLKSKNLYKGMGWDMDEVWSIDDGNAYPRLKWEAEQGVSKPILTIHAKDADITADDVLTFYAEQVTSNIGGGITYTYYQCVPDEPLIINTSSRTQQVRVTISSEDYSHLKWSGISGEEADMISSSEERLCQLECGSSTPLKLHAIFADQHFGTYIANVQVECESYSMQFQIKFVNENPNKPVCPTPTIEYSDGELSFSCNAEGTPEYHVTITDPDVNTYTVNSTLQLARTYTVEAYATAEGYLPSEKSKLVLCWIDTKLIDRVDELTEEEGLPIQIRLNQGSIIIAGISKGTLISAHSLSGMFLGSTTCIAETATLNIPTSTDAIILKVGTNSLKIVF